MSTFGVDQHDVLALLLKCDPVGHRPRRELLEAVKTVFGLSSSVDELDAQLSRDLADHIDVDTDIASVLCELMERIPVGIVTNGGTVTQRAKLKRIGLDHVPVVISGEVGVEKPEERIFYLGLNAIGVEAADANAVVFVGDDVVRDIEGARSAGLQAVWSGANCEDTYDILAALVGGLDRRKAC